MVRVGILGGGQLSLMLAHAAVKMGLRPIILSEDSSCPTAQVYSGTVFGSANDPQVLDHFFSQVDLVVFENEFVDCEILEQVSSRHSVKFSPGLGVIFKLQDKLSQKKLMVELGIPTAEFDVLDPERSLPVQLTEYLRKFGGACVLKWAKLGYDGKGVLIIKDTAEDFVKAQAFCQEAQARDSSVYVERRVDFKRELALIAVSSVQGEFSAYPVVVSEQKMNICYRVYGPACSVGVSTGLADFAKECARKLAKSVGMVGSFALEFFEDTSGKLWVNEIAPRVHNSGHYTQEAASTDQFENHWRAVLGMPLGKTDVTPGFAMLNLLGPSSPCTQEEPPLPIPSERIHLHWYGKKKIFYKRKLGHLNGTVESFEDLDQLLSDLDRCEMDWLQRLTPQGGAGK